MPESYFHKDKLHLRISGTQKLLSSINKIHTITINKTDNDHSLVPRRDLANRRPAYSYNIRTGLHIHTVIFVTEKVMLLRIIGTMVEASHKLSIFPVRN